MEVDDVVAVHRQLQLAVVEADAGRERVAQVALADRPAVVAGPDRAAAVLAGDVGVDAEAARPGAGVVLLPDVGEVDVADLVLAVEGDEQPAVADGDVTGHESVAFAKGLLHSRRTQPPASLLRPPSTPLRRLRRQGQGPVLVGTMPPSLEPNSKRRGLLRLIGDLPAGASNPQEWI